MTNVYKNDDSDNYDEDFEDTHNENINSNGKSINKSKATNKSTNVLNKDIKIQRREIDTLNIQKSERNLTSINKTNSTNLGFQKSNIWELSRNNINKFKIVCFMHNIKNCNRKNITRNMKFMFYMI